MTGSPFFARLTSLPAGVRWGVAGLAAIPVLGSVFEWPVPAMVLAALLAGGLISWALIRAVETAAPSSAETPAEDLGRSDVASLIAALEIAAIILDSQRRVKYFNRYAADLFPGIATGQPLAMVSRDPDLIRLVEQVTRRGRTDTAEIAERILRDRRFLVTASALPHDRLLLLQFRDTSEQARLAQLRSDFIANASHELRTPLASIKGFIETLQGPARDDAQARARFLAIMEAQAGRMNRILDDLLSLSRIEMRAHLRPEGDVDVAETVSQVLRGLEPLAREAETRLTLVPPDGPMHVRGDEDELEQVVQNLVHNAIKYGRSGGHVVVSVARKAAHKGRNGQILIRVTDDGPGIAPEHLPRLTERFYRVDTARSRERGGTGLGLAIVKHILNRHRGELDITSELGKGSTFTVTLDELVTP